MHFLIALTWDSWSSRGSLEMKRVFRFSRGKKQKRGWSLTQLSSTNHTHAVCLSFSVAFCVSHSSPVVSLASSIFRLARLRCFFFLHSIPSHSLSSLSLWFTALLSLSFSRSIIWNRAPVRDVEQGGLNLKMSYAVRKGGSSSLSAHTKKSAYLGALRVGSSMQNFHTVSTNLWSYLLSVQVEIAFRSSHPRSISCSRRAEGVRWRVVASECSMLR